MIAVVVFGAGGHARVVIETLRQRDDVRLTGVLDEDRALWGGAVMGVPILGGDATLDEARARGASHFIVGVGMVRADSRRRQLFELATTRGLTPVSAIHATAFVSPSASLGEGVAILAGAIVNTGARVGDNVIVNTGAIVEHDCVIGPHAHLATGVRLSGDVRVGSGALVGIGASIRQGVIIGDEAVVGAGSVVIADVPSGTTVTGAPARPLKREIPA